MKEDKNKMEKAFSELNRLSLESEEDRFYQVILVTLITDVLKMAHGNQKRTAEILGISSNTLRAKIKKLGISVKETKL